MDDVAEKDVPLEAAVMATSATAATAAAAAVAASTAASPPPASTIASEPARAHAADLVLLGHMLSLRLVRDGVCSLESGFSRVWRDCVVPVAAASRTEWQMGMCAEITGDLESAAGNSFRNAVGRISHWVVDEHEGGMYQMIIPGPEGIGAVDVKPEDIKATSRAGAILSLWRTIPLTPSPYKAVREAGLELRKAGAAGPLPVTVLSGFTRTPNPNPNPNPSPNPNPNSNPNPNLTLTPT